MSNSLQVFFRNRHTHKLNSQTNLALRAAETEPQSLYNLLQTAKHKKIHSPKLSQPINSLPLSPQNRQTNSRSLPLKLQLA